MAITFPLSLADFMDTLPVSEVSFDPIHPVQVTGLSGGEILQAELAPPYWSGRVTLAPMAEAAALRVQAFLSALRVPGRAFDVARPHLPGPQSDPTGAGLSGYSPTAVLVSTSASTISMAGFPPGYVLTVGDMLQTVGSGATPPRGFYQLLEGGTADGTGAIGALQVTPHIRLGSAVNGGALTFVKPALRAVLVPGSVSSGITRNRITRGISFAFRQAIR